LIFICLFNYDAFAESLYAENPADKLIYSRSHVPGTHKVRLLAMLIQVRSGDIKGSDIY